MTAQQSRPPIDRNRIAAAPPPEPQYDDEPPYPTEDDRPAVQPFRQHDEAAWVAFSRVIIHGNEWSVTLREGVDAPTIEAMFEALAQTKGIGERVLAKYGATFEQMPAAEMPRSPGPARNTPSAQPERRNSPPPGFPEPSPGGGVWQITRLVIAGTLDKPIVEMWDANDRLRFPQTKAPAHIVVRRLRERYIHEPESTWDQITNDLGRCGSTKAVKWTVYWKPSSNGQYKDLDFIISDRLEANLAAG